MATSCMAAPPSLFAVQSVTVADYSWQFFERVLQRKYGDTEEQNAEKASQNFYSTLTAQTEDQHVPLSAQALGLCAGLITKLQDSGSKDDVKVPLRVLRDQIGRVWFARHVSCQAALTLDAWLAVSSSSDCLLSCMVQRQQANAGSAD